MKNPNITSDNENFARCSMYSLQRISLLIHIPFDTQWVQTSMTLNELKQCRILYEKGWEKDITLCSTVDDSWKQIHKKTSHFSYQKGMSDHADKILSQRANYKNLQFTFILTSVSIDGPYTIYDGNHRAIALASIPNLDEFAVRVNVFIGYSESFKTPDRGTFYCQ